MTSEIIHGLCASKSQFRGTLWNFKKVEHNVEAEETQGYSIEKVN